MAFNFGSLLNLVSPLYGGLSSAMSLDNLFGGAVRKSMNPSNLKASNFSNLPINIYGGLPLLKGPKQGLSVGNVASSANNSLSNFFGGVNNILSGAKSALNSFQMPWQNKAQDLSKLSWASSTAPSNIMSNPMKSGASSFPYMPTGVGGAAGGGGGGGGFNLQPMSPSPMVGSQFKASPFPSQNASTINPSVNTKQGAGNDFWNQAMGRMFEGVNIPQTLLGFGVSGLGGLMAPKVNAPDFSQLPSYQALQNLNIRNYEEMPKDLEVALDHDMDAIEKQEDQQFLALWKNRRPGADIETDSGFRNAWNEHKNSQAQRRSDYKAKSRMDFYARNLGITEKEMNRLSQIAQYDLATIMGQLGLDMQAAQSFKDEFSRIGTLFTSKGMGLDLNPSMSGGER